MVGGLTVVFVALILIAACSDPVSQELHKPVINSISFDRSQIFVNEFITVTADVSDKDNDPLVYTWSANGGTFTSTKNNPTQWHAGSTPGTYTLKLSVSDGTFTVEKSKDIKVVSHK